jgi:RNA polymerase sigma factor (sigma-70 family)
VERQKGKANNAKLADLLAKEHGHFLAFLKKRVGNENEAEEILQAAYAKGLRKLETIDKGENAVAWFFRLLRNSLIDHWRHRAVESKALSQYAHETDELSQRSQAALEKAVCACMKKLVKTVKPEYADAIEKVDLGEMGIQDYARRAGVSTNNATVRIHRARQSLKKRLVETCGTCAEHGCLDCTCKQV